MSDDPVLTNGNGNGKAKMKLTAVLAIMIVLGFFGILIRILAKPDVIGHDALLMLTSTLGAAFTGVIGYYFGSSQSSAAKTDILADQAKK